MENKAHQLLVQLKEKLDKQRDIKNYHVYVAYSHSANAGFLNKELGGVYRPVSLQNSIDGYYLLEYSDDKYASGVLDASAWSDFDTFIKSAKFAAFEDTNPAPIADKIDNPNVKVCDENIKNILLNNPEKISELLKNSNEMHKDVDLDIVNGSINFGYNQTALITSKGVDLQAESTSEGISFLYDDMVGYEKMERGFFDLDQIKEGAWLNMDYAKKSKAEKIKLENGKYKVLFYPDYAFSFLDEFVMSNIGGNGIDAGVVRFNKDDFINKKQIFNENIFFNIDQRKDMEIESFNYNSEGVVAQKFSVIENGRLVEPICDLKSAKKLGFESKSLSSLVECDVNIKDSYDEYFKKNERFILILSVLGMHTQNSVLGQYSLPCPIAIYVENGKMKAPVNIVISGDAFEKFMSEDFEFVKHEALDKPYLSFTSDVSFVE